MQYFFYSRRYFLLRTHQTHVQISKQSRPVPNRVLHIPGTNVRIDYECGIKIKCRIFRYFIIPGII